MQPRRVLRGTSVRGHGVKGVPLKGVHACRPWSVQEQTIDPQPRDDGHQREAPGSGRWFRLASCCWPRLWPLHSWSNDPGAGGFVPWGRSAGACTGCRRCDRACPMGIAVSRVEMVRNDRCIRCLSCMAACPEKGALACTAVRGRLLLRDAAVATAVLLLFSLPLAVAGALGWYRPAGRPAASSPAHAAGKDSRPFDPAALSPRMTLAETASYLGVEPGYLAELLGLEAQFDLSTPLIDIEEHPEYEQVTFGYVRDVLETRFGKQDSPP